MDNNEVLQFLIDFNNFFSAVVAILAFSLFIRSLSFNLYDRVSRNFALILFCIVVIYTGESIGSLIGRIVETTAWFKLQWIGIVFLPAAYIQFADALLETTGKPSRGRRRFLVRLTFFFSAIFTVLLATPWFIAAENIADTIVPKLEPTIWSNLFTAYFFIAIMLSAYIMWMAYSRTVLKASRRRMNYLIGGAVAMFLGSYPYTLIGSSIAVQNPAVFIGVALLGNILVTISLFGMSYAVAFYGVSWPDRVVKSRLFKWILRGPFTVIVTLLVMTIVWIFSSRYGTEYLLAIPIVMAVIVLFFEHAFTLFSPIWQRNLFNDGDQESLQLLIDLEERLITRADLTQFLEAVLAAICDHLQSETAFVADILSGNVEIIANLGDQESIPENFIEIHSAVDKEDENHGFYTAEGFLLLPLYGSDQDNTIGMVGVKISRQTNLDEISKTAVRKLGNRISLAIENRFLQKELFNILASLKPGVEWLQSLRAASRYDQSEFVDALDAVSQKRIDKDVKDALSHYWGGPKLTNNGLVELNITQQKIDGHDGNLNNAVRELLKEAVDQLKPKGERKFTGEWILYNILEMKFFQGRKVRDVAMRLSMSEADLYRKQRIAVEKAAAAIKLMEQDVIEERLVNGEMES